MISCLFVKRHCRQYVDKLGPVQTERFEAKSRSAHELGRFTPYHLSNREKEVQETGDRLASF